MPEPSESPDSARTPLSFGRHPRKKSRFIRVLVPLLFLIASGALVYGLLTFLKDQSRVDSHGLPEKPTPVRTIAPIDPKPLKKSAELKAEPIPTLPVPVPEQPQIVEPPPALPDGIEPITPGMAAMEVLEKFLAAKTLAERLPLIETQTPEAELAKSCLTGPLAGDEQDRDRRSGNQPRRAGGGLLSQRGFRGGRQPVNPQTLLVRIRGSAEPKVVVDPFLDSFGGRLAAYAKAPIRQGRDFPGDRLGRWPPATTSSVPNREKKLTLKLLSRDNTKEIARAYFGRQSKIGEMLEDGTYSLSYGKAKACTVMLRWNTEDNPAMPYLEAITIKTLDWNP